MPGKSRSKRGKSATQSRKTGDKDRSGTPLKPVVAVQESHPAPTPVIPTPSARIITSTVKPEPTRYIYIKSELMTIGILAGVMLIGLIVLAQVLG